MARKLSTYGGSLADLIKSFTAKLEYGWDSTQLHEEKIKLLDQIEEEQAQAAQLIQENDKLEDLKRELSELKKESKNQIQNLEANNSELLQEKELIYKELQSMKEKLLQEARHRRRVENEILNLQKTLTEKNDGLEKLMQENRKVEELQKELKELKEDSRFVQTEENNIIDPDEQLKKPKEEPRNQIQHLEPKNDELHTEKRETIMITTTSGSGAPPSLHQTNKPRVTMSQILKEVGLKDIICMLKSEDLDIRTQAVRVVANLAAEDNNQKEIVEEGGLDSLLALLEIISEDSIITHRGAAGAIANLAMTGLYQEEIVNKGGLRLLANAATKTDDCQTLRMVSGAIANLCGNANMFVSLKKDGGIKALVGMACHDHVDVIAQVVRGICNFAKCESHAISHGHRKGKSLLIDDGALEWMVNSSNFANYSTSIRRHIDLALCHLAQNEDNTRDIIRSGGIKELVRISQESSRNDLQYLAKKALNSNPAFQKEIN